MMALDLDTESIASLRPLQPHLLEIRLPGHKMRKRDRGNDTGYVEELRREQPLPSSPTI